MVKTYVFKIVLVMALFAAVGCKSKGPVPGSESPSGGDTPKASTTETTGAHPGAANPNQADDPHAGLDMNAVKEALKAPEVDESGMLDIGAIKFKVPDDWKAEAPKSSMRRAQLSADGTKGAAELIVFYFGPQGAGSAEENIQRWIGQFSNPDGSQVKDAKLTSVKVAGRDATRVEVAGQYASSMTPGQNTVPKPDQRLIAAIVQTAEGPYYFKFLGPNDTVTAQADAFDGLIGSIVAAP
jgi:hypothetical protein